MSTSVDTPHNYALNCVAYTGTHDNNTTLGWYRNETSDADRKRLSDYVGKDITARNVTDEMCRMVYASVAEIAILPVQDILNSDERARMNTPGTTENNWQWRLTEGALTQDRLAWLKKLVNMYNRR